MEPYDIKEQLESLADSVDRYKPDQYVSVSVGKQANILLDQMAAALPDNPVATGTPKFSVTGGSIIGGSVRAADVSAVLRLVANQVPRRAPSFA